MNLEFSRYLLITLLITLTSCCRQTNEDVIADAYHHYNIMRMRYEEMLIAQDDIEIIEQARLFGLNQNLSFGSSLWESLCGNDHLVCSQGAPLHRAVYFIQRDIKQLEQHAHNFERRGLFNRPLYENLCQLRRNLCSIVCLLQAQKAYSQESQFIEQQQVQKNQLYEQKRQTNLLNQLVEKDDYKKHKPKKRTKERVNILYVI